jgi:hypothetical protein
VDHLTSVLFVFAILFCSVLHRSLAMTQSFVVLGCRVWNALPHDMKILPTRASFVSAVRKMVRGVDASNWVIYLFIVIIVILRTCFVSVAPNILLNVECYECVLLWISYLIYKALVCNLLFFGAFASDIIFYLWSDFYGWLTFQWSLGQWVGMVWSHNTFFLIIYFINILNISDMKIIEDKNETHTLILTQIGRFEVESWDKSWNRSCRYKEQLHRMW